MKRWLNETKAYRLSGRWGRHLPMKAFILLSALLNVAAFAGEHCNDGAYCMRPSGVATMVAGYATTREYISVVALEKNLTETLFASPKGSAISLAQADEIARRVAHGDKVTVTYHYGPKGNRARHLTTLHGDVNRITFSARAKGRALTPSEGRRVATLQGEIARVEGGGVIPVRRYVEVYTARHQAGEFAFQLRGMASDRAHVVKVQRVVASVLKKIKANSRNGHMLLATAVTLGLISYLNIQDVKQETKLDKRWREIE